MYRVLNDLLRALKMQLSILHLLFYCEKRKIEKYFTVVENENKIFQICFLMITVIKKRSSGMSRQIIICSTQFFVKVSTLSSS